MAVTNDLVADRRVARHAAALAEAGFEVTVVGRSLPASMPLQPSRWHAERLILRNRRGWRFYAEMNRRLARWIADRKPDIVWANDTDTLPGCYVAARRSGARLVMDAHELFPEVPEIQHKPLVRWVWRTIEKQLMPKCDALITVCQSIAEHYRKALGVEMTVVRNISEKMKDKSGKMDGNAQLSTSNFQHSTLLYQGAVNLGRGVDWAIDAMEWLPECRLVVAGGGDLLDRMKSYAASKAWAGRVVFLGPLAPSELELLTPQADVGLVMLEDLGLSYRYALPNRIGDVVAAGVPMVVSELPEMSAVVRRFDIGEVMSRPGAQALAEAVKKVLARGKDGYDFAAAREDMDWNKEKQKLIGCLNAITQ